MISPLEFSVEIAQKAGRLLAESFSPFGTMASLKSDQTLVTQADLDSNTLITSAIKEHFPEDLILSEEDNTQAGDLTQPTWIIDPLDGTTNFSLGLPIWGVSIARLVNGFPQTAALYFPILDELFCAEAGGGAFLNNAPLEPVRTSSSQGISFFACCSRTFRQYQVSLPYKVRILGAAAYNICSVARNTAILCMEVSPKIWDLAGGWLLVEESGGVIELLETETPFPLSSQIDYSSKSFPLLAGKDRGILNYAEKNIQKRKD
ncbi:MAG: inositol monophosphatase family protein [Chloroflexota bacterium]